MSAARAIFGTTFTSLLHLDPLANFDITQSAEHLNWLHFLFCVGPGHLTPNSLARTRIELESVCQSPHPNGSFSSGQASSHVTEHSPGRYGVMTHYPALNLGFPLDDAFHELVVDVLLHREARVFLASTSSHPF